MLFNSYVFLFLYLPITLVGFAACSRYGREVHNVWWLALSSLFFYGWWAPKYLAVLLASVVLNFALGQALRAGGGSGSQRRRVLLAGIGANLLALGYFKYSTFVVENLNGLFGLALTAEPMELPLGISFFTFTQIAFLVDTYRRPSETRGGFGEYLLFVSFFPHLLAGPIVHHGQLMPQMEGERFRSLRLVHLKTGGSIFLVGLAKKVLVADTFAEIASPIFGAAHAGTAPSLALAWVGALSYALQLYFDFSGYSDMAIGLARMFGIHFPDNFDSPYKATSVIDFWRRWHITLSNFLRDYLYIPLGGSRRGPVRRYVNLFVTMLLGGLWHGAGWTFVLWGALHGSYLVVNHAFRALRERLGQDLTQSTWFGIWAGRGLTFLAVLVAWVFFRAESFGAARSILAGMVGSNGLVLPESYLDALSRVPGFGSALLSAGARAGELAPLPRGLQEILLLLGLAYAVVLWAPNTTEIFERHRLTPRVRSRSDVSPGRWNGWESNLAWAIGLGVLLALSLAAVAGKTEFIYFQF